MMRDPVLVEATRLLVHRVDDGDGVWRWWVYRPDGSVYGGSAATGTKAREICEGLTGETDS
jgi:hypothetical protein